MLELFSRLNNELTLGHDAILISIIRDTGSTPRGAGSMMLVTAEGQLCGTVGGGPAEYESNILAQQLLKEKHSGNHEYRLHQNIIEDIGSECGGDVFELFQYIDAKDTFWRELVDITLRQLNAHTGGYFLLARNGSHGALIDRTSHVLCGQVENPSAYCTETNLLDEKFFSCVLPVGENVYLFGGGHCSKALCPVLTNLGFRVTVFDDRAEYITEERFPQAVGRICCAYDFLEEFITFTPDDYVVIMTTGHKNDFKVEQCVLKHELTYIGCIGSKKKVASVNQRLLDAGYSEERIRFVHSPIGLSIGAVTPEEIAISIAGEMIQIRAKRRKEKEIQVHGCPMHE